VDSSPDPSHFACCEAVSTRIYDVTRSCRSSTYGIRLPRGRDRVPWLAGTSGALTASRDAKV